MGPPYMPPHENPQYHHPIGRETQAVTGSPMCRVWNRISSNHPREDHETMEPHRPPPDPASTASTDAVGPFHWSPSGEVNAASRRERLTEQR